MTTALPVMGQGYSSLVGRPIDNTALATYMTCPKKYEYSMLLHRRGSEATTSPALAYGSAWHHALEAHYLLGGSKGDFERNFDAVQHFVTSKWKGHDRPDDYRTLDRVLLEYRSYVRKWGMPDEEDAATVGWPEQPMVEMASELSWPGALHPYSGKIDRIITAQGQYFIEDHKTTSRWSTGYFRTFELKNQMMGYAWMGQQLLGKPVAGVRINCHVARSKDSQFERQIISFSQDRLKDWAENYNGWVRRMEADAASGEYIRNFDACDAKFGMCQYAGVCSMSPALRDRVLAQDFPEQNPWNPLAVEGDDDE